MIAVVLEDQAMVLRDSAEQMRLKYHRWEVSSHRMDRNMKRDSHLLIVRSVKMRLLSANISRDAPGIILDGVHRDLVVKSLSQGHCLERQINIILNSGIHGHNDRLEVLSGIGNDLQKPVPWRLVEKRKRELKECVPTID